MKKEKIKLIDRRKIPTLFRAVEKSNNPTVYHGYLISDDLCNFISFSTHDKETSHFKERVLEKEKFNFTKIEAEDFSLNVRRAIRKMEDQMQDAKFEYEAAMDNHAHAKEKFNDILERL